jgi:predicted SnoaL-like aldol condensation-catalyzing enzyme
MATSNIEKVLTVFQGIAAKDADLATKHMNPKKYLQHDPHAADGVDGLKDYIRVQGSDFIAILP